MKTECQKEIINDYKKGQKTDCKKEYKKSLKRDYRKDFKKTKQIEQDYKT